MKTKLKKYFSFELSEKEFRILYEILKDFDLTCEPDNVRILVVRLMEFDAEAEL